MIRTQHRATPFPYTTLFRSLQSENAAFGLCALRAVLARVSAGEFQCSFPRFSAAVGKEGAVHTGNLCKSSRQPPLILVIKDRKSTRLNSSHSSISYAVFCLK